jgi:Tfp pilus assembly protein PilN
MRIEQGLLPDDYLEQRAERRTNFISLSLFVVVMSAVFAAFLVTNREWSRVQDAQQNMNSQYEQAAERIRDLRELEKQQEQMLSKAEVAAALIERVPRSVLLAELINRMPVRLSLLEFELKAEEVKPAKKTEKDGKESKDGGDKSKTKSLKDAQRPKTKEEAAADARKVESPKHAYSLSLVGVAPSDGDVSKYLTALNEFPLLEQVRLEVSEEKEVEGQWLRQFKITMRLKAGADVSTIDPLLAPARPKDPMSDEIQILSPSQTAGVTGDVEKLMSGAASGEED